MPMNVPITPYPPHALLLDATTLSKSAGSLHREAITNAKRIFAMSPEQMVAAANEALEKLAKLNLLSEDERVAFRELVGAATGGKIASANVADHVRAFASPIIASTKASPVAVTLANIAMDSAEHEAAMSAQPIETARPVVIWLCDVAGAVVGGALGGAVGNVPGAVLGALVGAVAASALAW